MEKRIDLDYHESEKIEVHRGDGGTLTVKLSSYDIPHSIVGSRAADGGILIRFNYLDREPEVQKQINATITLLTGKHSGKILGMIVDSKKEPVGTIKFVVESLRGMEPKLLQENQRMNFGVVGGVLSRKGTELLSAI